MTEVRIRSKKLKQEIRGRPKIFLVTEKAKQIEPLSFGRVTSFINRGHHLARALYDLGQKMAYCKVLDKVSNLQPSFWKYMEDDNEVYLKDYERKRHCAK